MGYMVFMKGPGVHYAKLRLHVYMICFEAERAVADAKDDFSIGIDPSKHL